MQTVPYTIVIPSNRPFDSMQPLLRDIAKQSFVPEEVIIVADVFFSSSDEKEQYSNWCIQSLPGIACTVVNHVDHDFVPQQGAAYVRNRGIAHVHSTHLLCIDDDNRFADDFLKQVCLSGKQESNQESVVWVPTELYRKTGRIRSQGYKKFYPWLGRAKPFFLPKEENKTSIMFCSSNCFWGETTTIQHFPFPEKMKFVYEDFARSTTMTLSGVSLLVTSVVEVQHMIRKKTALEDSYIATSESAFLKGRNRVWWVKAMKPGSRMIYYAVGMHIHTIALLVKIWRYAAWSDKCSFSVALIKGTWSGITQRA